MKLRKKKFELATGNEVYVYEDAWGVMLFSIDADGNWVNL